MRHRQRERAGLGCRELADVRRGDMRPRGRVVHGTRDMSNGHRIGERGGKGNVGT